MYAYHINLHLYGFFSIGPSGDCDAVGGNETDGNISRKRTNASAAATTQLQQQLTIQQQELIQQLQIIQRQYLMHQSIGLQPLLMAQQHQQQQGKSVDAN